MNNIHKRTSSSTRFKKKGNYNSPRNNGNNNNRGSKKRRVSSIDPARLVSKAMVKDNQPAFVASRGFADMPINSKLKSNILKKGYSHPTQIQEETLDHLFNGSDLIGVANTGTGKTGAFLIPVINQLLENSRPFQTLVVVPTRELALQVEQEFKSLTNGLNLYSSCFIGGTSVNKDLSQLRRRNHLIIGTPGRLMDLSNRGALKMHEISTLILDEFDRMLDMGFRQDIKKMIELMPKRRQTMLFSATIDKQQSELIKSIVKNPIEVRVSSGTSTSDQVDQDVINVPVGGDKFDLLLGLMGQPDFEKVLLFTETKHQADKVSRKLNTSGITSDQIHGNKSQNYRIKALSKFKRGHVRVLVATDVAARGIDVSDISHVINYQLPLTFDSYVHRIGRTGRAGKPGKALTFID